MHVAFERGFFVERKRLRPNLSLRNNTTCNICNREHLGATFGEQNSDHEGVFVDEGSDFSRPDLVIQVRRTSYV